MQANRKTRQGTVMSTKMDKTVVVAVETVTAHPLYRKRLRRTKRFNAHDANNECGLGDVVSIRETRPISRTKRWEVVEILRRGDVADVQPRTIGRELERPPAEAEPEAAAAAPEPTAAAPEAKPRTRASAKAAEQTDAAPAEEPAPDDESTAEEDEG